MPGPQDLADRLNELTRITARTPADVPDDLDSLIKAGSSSAAYNALIAAANGFYPLGEFPDEAVILADLAEGGRFRDEALALIGNEDERGSFGLPDLVTTQPTDRFDTEDADALINQAMRDWTASVGPEIASNLAIAGPVRQHMYDNMLNPDRPAEAPADANFAAADIAMQPHEDNAQAFPLTGGLREFIFQDYVKGVVLSGGISVEAGALLTSNGVMRELEPRLDVPDVFSTEEIIREEAQNAQAGIIRDFQNPELFDSLKGIGGGNLTRATEELYTSQAEQNRFDTGEPQLISTRPEGVAQAQQDLESERSLLRAASAAGTNRTKLNDFTNLLLGEAGISHPLDLVGDERAIQTNTVNAMKEQLNQALVAGVTPNKLVAMGRALMDEFDLTVDDVHLLVVQEATGLQVTVHSVEERLGTL